MNLKLYLIARIVLIAFSCLLITAVFVLYQADQNSRLGVVTSAEAIDHQLELQLLRISVGSELKARFPDIDVWSETGFESGRCVHFVAANEIINRTSCRGETVVDRNWPLWFEKIYQWIFNPGRPVVRQVNFRGRNYGTITVSNSASKETARAWRDVVSLMALALLNVIGISILVYLSIKQVIKPAKTVVAGLRQMEDGELSVRLPNFEITEWQRTGEAINRLIAKQEMILSERKELALKLMDIQEAERRYIVRELHDEFGQCLAGLNAVASLICQTAKEECPQLYPEGQNVERITRRMMVLLRSMLLRLRPSEIDELGLTAGLKALVAEWNSRGKSKIGYKLVIQGNCDDLPDPIPSNVYRIVQECLTNVSKHSSAAQVKIQLERFEPNLTGPRVGYIELLIQDDGIADGRSLPNSSGTGILGIRERVAALAGTLVLKKGNPSGLAVHVKIPLQPIPKICK